MPARSVLPSWALVFALTAPGMAAVDIVTLPTREGVQLTIYNSEDITMVREHRLLTVKEGVNRIQFSWANTLIDATSIEFRILDQQDKVDLVDTTYPTGRNDALQWNIESKLAGKVAVEIRYFTSGITWSADYVGIANEDETRLNLTGYVRVTNTSGEVYDNAQTRLVVGTINLVEKIAELARRPPPGWVKIEPKLPKPLFVGVPRSSPVKNGRDALRWTLEDKDNRPGRGQAGDEAGPLRVLPLHHRGPRGHQGQGAQAAGRAQGRRRPAGVYLQTHRSQPRLPSPACGRGTTCRGAGGGGILHQVLPLQEPQAPGRRGQREEGPLGDGEPGPLTVAERHGAAVLRVQVEGPRLRRRHGDQVRAHRRPRRGQRGSGQGHHHPTSPPRTRSSQTSPCGNTRNE